MATIQNQIVKALLEQYGVTYRYRTDIYDFYKKDHIVICLPTQSEVYYYHLKAIATMQLDKNEEQFNEDLKKITQTHRVLK